MRFPKVLTRASIVALLLLLLRDNSGHAMQRSCPDFLNTMSSAALKRVGSSNCAVYTDFHAMLLNHVVPHGDSGNYYRYQRIWGPRFINYPDFFKKIGPRVGFNPWFMYSPAPTTWNSWQQTAEAVMKSVNRNIGASGAVPGLPRTAPGLLPLSAESLRQIHGAAIQDLPQARSDFRTDAELGLALWRATAAPILLLNAGIAYGGKTLTTFRQTRCFEDMDGESQELVDQRLYFGIPFRAEIFPGSIGDKPTFLSCGFYIYPGPEQVPALVEQMLKDTNDKITRFYEDDVAFDPVAVAARAQRWLVAIHPFNDGNGRTSRFVMEYILTSLGLPPPILLDMNLDTMLTEEQWAEEIAKGMIRYNQFLAQCLSNPDREACQITPATLD